MLYIVIFILDCFFLGDILRLFVVKDNEKYLWVSLPLGLGINSYLLFILLLIGLPLSRFLVYLIFVAGFILWFYLLKIEGIKLYIKKIIDRKRLLILFLVVFLFLMFLGTLYPMLFVDSLSIWGL